MSETLISYSREVVPMFIALNTANDILKEWKADEPTVQKILGEIKLLQESLKAYIEDTNSDLVREIKDLQLDIKLAIQSAAKGTAYSAPELKGYFAARAKEKVGDVVSKGELFSELEGELS